MKAALLQKPALIHEALRRGPLLWLLASLFACHSAKEPSLRPSAQVEPGHSTRVSCDTTTPVTLADARVIVANRCSSCHSPSGSADDYDWTEERALIAHRRNIAAVLIDGAMPPSGAAQLSAQDRHALICWANGG